MNLDRRFQFITDADATHPPTNNNTPTTTNNKTYLQRRLDRTLEHVSLLKELIWVARQRDKRAGDSE
jgi:hypothetical protein